MFSLDKKQNNITSTEYKRNNITDRATEKKEEESIINTIKEKDSNLYRELLSISNNFISNIGSFQGHVGKPPLLQDEQA